MANINSPLPEDPDTEITFDRPIFKFTLSKYDKFINRIETQKSYHRADILYSEHVIFVSFTQPLEEAPKRFGLCVSCKPLGLQLSSMVQICRSLSESAVLLGVEQLHLTAKRLSTAQDDNESKQWLELIYLFRGTKWVHVAGDYSTNIVLALQLSIKWRETVLPALHKLSIQEPKQHHVPLREAVSSFTHSRRLSGSFIGVEYERLCIDKMHETGPFSQRSTIEVLSDDDLLKIFLHCLEDSPKIWPTLVHVCQNWRHIIFKSPRSLHLQLYFKHGTPVSKTLDCWPALPIVLHYGGSSTLDPLAPEDEDNVMAALKQSGRVSSISLTITDSLLAKFSTIAAPFSELEELDLLSRDNVQLTLPAIFQWGPRLRRLHLTGIAIPALSQLSSSKDLVDLQLHEIPSDEFVSPKAFANALFGMTQLRSLSLHFHSLPPSQNYIGLPPSSEERVVLPSFMYLKYRGTSQYLDSLVSRIDAPRLGDVDITFFNERTLDASQLGRFVDRIEMLNSPSQADIISSESAISIRFTQPKAPQVTRFGLRISCNQLAWQLSSMARILDQFYHVLSSVKDLGVNTAEPPTRRGDVGGEQWPDLIRGFGGAVDLRVAGELATDILRALCPPNGGHPTVLPALRVLRVREPLSMQGPLWDAVQSLEISRSLSGSSLQVYATQYPCHVCSAKFKELRSLERHLIQMRAYHIVCPHCDDFESLHQYTAIRRFREHLESKHPELAHIHEHTQHDDLTEEDQPTQHELFEILRQSRQRSPHLDTSDLPSSPTGPASTSTPTDT